MAKLKNLTSDNGSSRTNGDSRNYLRPLSAIRRPMWGRQCVDMFTSRAETRRTKLRRQRQQQQENDNQRAAIVPPERSWLIDVGSGDASLRPVLGQRDVEITIVGDSGDLLLVQNSADDETPPSA